MAGLIDPNDIAKARQSGYSDNEISAFLSEKHPEQFKAAREAGYNDKEILAHLEGDKPSGVVAGAAHGLASNVAGGLSSTLGLAGIKSETLDGIAAAAEPKDYKAAHLIREGGHWYNPSDYQPSAIPQILAEQAPGLATDFAVGKAGAKLGSVAGPRGAFLGGLGGFAGSMAARTFGHGAHANADARTGVPNSPVETTDITREVGKQALQAPLNMVGASRILPEGGKLAGSALAKYLTTVGTETGVGAASDVVDQLGTTLGSKDGVKYDPSRTAEAAATRAVGSGVLVAPRLAADTASGVKFRKFEGDHETASAAKDLANRHVEAQGDRSLVGPLGGTKTAADVVHSVHKDVHSELAAATKNETGLSQDNANTLKRINEGVAASPDQVRAIASEASPETMGLARQALLSKRLRDMGDLGADKFTGGISGAMERTLRPIYNPLGTAAAAAASFIGHSGGLGMLGTFAPPALGAIYGGYLGARALDKLTGSRSPLKGFTERYADGSPTRAPAAPAEPTQPQTTSVPQVAPPQPAAQPWGAPAPAEAAPSFNPTALKMLQQKLKAGLPPEPEAPLPAAPEAPSFNPTALKMLQQKLKAGLPPEPTPAPEPPPQMPVINPVALKMTQRNMKAGLPPEPAAPTGPKPEELPAKFSGMLGKGMPDALPDDFSSLLSKNPVPPEAAPAPTVLSKVTKKLKARTVLPPDPAVVSEAPASPAIGALMQKLNGNGQGAPAAPQPPQAPQAPQPTAAPPAAPALNGTPISVPQPTAAPAAPQPPMISKISKKLNGEVKETPHPAPPAQEHIDPDTGEVFNYTPLTKEQLYGRQMSHEEFARHEADAEIAKGKLKPDNRDVYETGVVMDRLKRERELQALSQHAASADDVPLAKLLLQELHHIRRGSTAENAIKYAGLKMSTAMRARAEKLMTGPFHKMWDKYD